MDVSAISQTNALMMQILQTALQSELELQEKLITYNLSTALQASDPGRGVNLDVQG